VSRSLLEAIKQGDFNFEPPAANGDGDMPATVALPGTAEKLDVLAERMRLGLPLWHSSDRRTYDDANRD
jgi:hypothetical protein